MKVQAERASILQKSQQHGTWLQGIEDSRYRQVGKWKDQRRDWPREPQGAPGKASVGGGKLCGNDPNHIQRNMTDPDSKHSRQIHSYTFCWRQNSSVYKVNDMLSYLIKKGIYRLHRLVSRGNCISSSSE